MLTITYGFGPRYFARSIQTHGFSPQTQYDLLKYYRDLYGTKITEEGADGIEALQWLNQEIAALERHYPSLAA